MGGEQTIPIDQIASVDIGMPGLQQVVVESAGGKKHKIVIRQGDKSKFRDAIYELKV